MIINVTVSFLNCDTGSIFIVDESRRELWTVATLDN
jgi:hypothetical protein